MLLKMVTLMMPIFWMFNLKSYKAVTGRTDDCTRRMGMLLQKQREYSYIRTEKLQMHAYIEILN